MGEASAMLGNDREETYSVIFSALKHPVRRKILRMLCVEELTYSQILSTLGIDSGHLNYHLENLGELLAKTEQGKYRLSAFGKATVGLMTGVEETKISTSEAKHLWSPKNRLMLLLQIFAIVMLIIAGLTFLNVEYGSTYFLGSSGRLDDMRLVEPNASIMSFDWLNVRSFPTDTLTTRYQVFFEIEVITNATIWVQLREGGGTEGTPGPTYNQVPSGGYLIYNETLLGPYDPHATVKHDVLVPLKSLKEQGYLLNGLSLYNVSITNLGKWTDYNRGILLNYTASIGLETSYPFIEETDYPYFYHGIIFIALALVTALLPYLLPLTKHAAERLRGEQSTILDRSLQLILEVQICNLVKGIFP